MTAVLRPWTPEDAPALAAALRAGFIAEDIERQKLRYGSERFDVETHARLRTDRTPDLEPLPIVDTHT